MSAGTSPDVFALLERLGLPEIAESLRALAKTRPSMDPLDALEADGFGELISTVRALAGPSSR